MRHSVEMAPGVPPVAVQKDKLRVLLMDDDLAYSHLCQRYLSQEKRVEYDIVAVANAVDGLEACCSGVFDCLLVDYCLPEMSGTQIIQKLQSKMGASAPPAIIMTAMGGQSAAAEAVRAGAVDFLQKGVVSAECLVRSISNAVEKGQLKRSIDLRSKELLEANEQLQARNAEIQRFYQSVSHEVKTPLAAAREFIAIVLDGIVGETTDEQKEMLHYARESCDQIADHFNELVSMTQLEAGKVTLNKRFVSFDSVLQRVMAATNSTIENKGVQVSQEVPRPLPLVYMDGNRIIQVLSNLLGNAIKYTEPGGRITLEIQLHDESDEIEVAVSDTGCGIKQEDLPRIFDRLYQIKPDGVSQIDAGLGLGLGLSIAREIVQLHNGEIWAESEIGKGSKFIVRLPIGVDASGSNSKIRENNK